MVKTPAAVNKLTAEFVRLASSDARLYYYRPLIRSQVWHGICIVTSIEKRKFN